MNECQTNVFSLTELYGLNWCSLTTPQNYQYGTDVEQDPVLKAYGECLNYGLLCTWRRKPHLETPTGQPNASPVFKLDSSKELWVFWYTQEKPAKLESLLQSGLTFGEDPQDLTNGLNYETRILFFKSLHNVIERCLLKNGYIRFGKWFARPLEAPVANGNCSIPQYINGISFNFFLHGDNHVCMTVTVQRQPPLLKLSHAHFSSTKKQPIILGPWSLQASLLPNQPLSFQNSDLFKGSSIGKEGSIAASLNYATMMFDSSTEKPGKVNLNNLSLKEIQTAVTKQWNDWKKFQALPVDGHGDIAEDFTPSGNGHRVPKMVLVEIDGVKMFYPSCFVGVLAEETPKPTVKKPDGVDPLSCDEDQEVEQIFASASKLSSTKSVTKVPGCMRYWRKGYAGVRSARRLLEDACLHVPHNSTLLQNSGLNAEDDTRWNFFDYLRRYCYCRNCSTVAASQEEPMFPFTTPTPIGDAPGPSSHAMHRSPPLIETLTPDHSPNFLETLGPDAERDRETPIWSTQFKRRDTVGKRLQTKEMPRVDVLDALRSQHNLMFNETAVRRVPSPFLSITCISPEPDTNYKKSDIEEGIRTFEYKFNPLKKDSIESKPYHKHNRDKRPLGPDRDRDCFFYLNDEENNSRTPNPFEPATSSSTAIDNHPLNGFQENFSFSDIFSTDPLPQSAPMPNSMVQAIKEPVIKKKNEKPKKTRKTKWPSLDLLDVMHFSISEAEEAYPCVSIPEIEPSTSKILPTAVNVKYLNDREKIETNPTEVQDMEQTMEYNGDVNEYFTSMDDAYDQVLGPNAMEATPPWITTEEENLQRVGPPSFQHPYSSDTAGDSTILSPPASNESHATASINTASVGSIHQYVAGPASHGQVNVHDSLSIIYPTPPTPMQQFSPQSNHLISSTLMGDHVSSWHPPPSVTSNEVNEKLLDAELLIHGLNHSPVYSEIKEVQAPDGDGFANLFGGEANSHLTSTSKDIQTSLKTRVKRAKLRKPPDYMSIMSAQRKDTWASLNHQDKLSNFNSSPGALLHQQQSSSGPLEQLGSMIPPDVRLSQPSTSGMNFQPFGMPHQNGLMGTQNFGRPFGSGSGFPMRSGMPPQLPQPNQQPMMSMFQNDGMFAQNQTIMQQPNQMQPGSFNRAQFMFPGSNFDPNMSANMPPKSMFPPGPFQNQQSMMFRGMSSGGSVIPIPGSMGGNQPPIGSSTVPMGQNTGSPMPPPPYNSFGSPALRTDHHHIPQRTCSNPSLVNNTLMPTNNLAPVSSADGFGGSSSALFNTLQLKDVNTILQDGRSFIISLLLQDTLLNLHYDSIFDACPICSCNGNIRGYELGIYMRTPDCLFVIDRLQHQPQLQNSPRLMTDLWTGFTITPGVPPAKCSCGFSAVRHRYLSVTGLFPADIREATGLEPTFVPKEIPRRIWFDPASKNDYKFLDLLQHLCNTRDLANMIMQSEYICEINRLAIENKSMEFAGSPDYITPRTDSELNEVCTSVIDLACSNSASNIIRPSKATKAPILHQWGVQIANGTLEPKEAEFLGIIREILPFVDEAIRLVRFTKTSNKIVDGPLSWGDFHRKASKSATKTPADEKEGGHAPEKIPNVICATEKESILVSPQLLHAWEKLSIGPYDQSKDVLYLAVAPDSNVVVEKCKIYMEELSKVYEKCRFGRHVRILTKESLRDGIIRINHKSMGPLNDPDLERIFRIKQSSDKKMIISRIKSFAENFVIEASQFFKTNDAIFDRRMYFETLCRDSLQQNYTSLATSNDSNSMPPPALPVQSPSSVLSSTSGPSSLGPLQQSPAAGQPSPATVNYGSVLNPNLLVNPNLAGIMSGTEPLTPESQIGTPGSQHDQNNLPNEASIDLEVQKLMAENSTVLPHVIVIYLINPFSFGGDAQESHLSRLATVVLMRAFNTFLHKLDVVRRPQIQLELINLQTVYDYSSFVSDSLREERHSLDPVEYSSVNDKMTAQDGLRRMAFAVYQQSRILLAENVRNIIPKSMTRFGPASMMKDILDGIRDSQKNSYPTLFKIPSAPFVLAPQRSIGTISMTGANNRVHLVNPDEKVLFVSYCLVDEDWLCAAVTDEIGHLSENVLINLSTADNKNSAKYKNRSQIYDALSRLWLFIQSELSYGTKNWRVVIGRLGRMGHGEFKVWTHLLSKKNLRAYNNSLKGRDKEVATPGPSASFGPTASNGCKSCAAIPGYQEMPAILSACLITTEPEPNLRVFPTLPGGELAAKSGKGKLTNGLDPSITHIVVFPTSPDLQSAEQQGGAGIEEDNFMSLFEEGSQHMQDDEDLVGNLFDDQNLFSNYATETDNTIDNQPMATGFAVSLAPAYDLPNWFWASCPSAKRRLPVHLKSSLHINASSIQQNEELLGNKSAGSEFHHPLDSTSTDEVLRYVLETYNALSWLNIDLTTGTRRSCLPVHIQSLLRLYRSVGKIFS